MVRISYKIFAHIFLAVIIMLILCSCEAPTSSARFEETYILIGNLVSGEPISHEFPIFLGKTVSVPNGNLFDAFITDAEVTIYNSNGEAETELFFSVWMSDSASVPQMGYIDFQQTFLPQAGEQYRIVAKIPNSETGATDSVWAETTMPAAINVVADSCFAGEYQLPLPELEYEDADERHPLRIQTPDASPIRLHLVLYCLDDWQDVRYIGEFGFGENEALEEEDQYEDSSNGSPRRVENFFEYTAELADDGHYYVDIDAYHHLFVFYGAYQIKIYSVDENYYRYLYKSEGYRFGGIHNGFGYFGGKSGTALYTRVVNGNLN